MQLDPTLKQTPFVNNNKVSITKQDSKMETRSGFKTREARQAKALSITTRKKIKASTSLTLTITTRTKNLKKSLQAMKNSKKRDKKGQITGSKAVPPVATVKRPQKNSLEKCTENTKKQQERPTSTTAIATSKSGKKPKRSTARSRSKKTSSMKSTTNISTSRSGETPMPSKK